MGLVSIDSSFPEVYKKLIIFKVQRELRELFVSLKHTIQKAFLDAIFSHTMERWLSLLLALISKRIDGEIRGWSLSIALSLRIPKHSSFLKFDEG